MTDERLISGGPTTVDFLSLPRRSPKPRETGVTHVLDKGLGPSQVEDLLTVAAGSIDIVKLGWGTAAVTTNLPEKVEIYRQAGIPVCLGGTLLEVVLTQGKLEDYMAWVKDMGIDHVEVSDGTIALDHAEKLRVIERLARDFTVLSEVGSKSEDVIFAPKRWVQMIQKELEAGSWKVITEGRESGTVGVYHADGKVKEGLIEEIREAIEPGRLLFEAPGKKQQVWFIKQFGSDVNLGNIAPDEVISVETLRLGLRGDTLSHFH
ncbi:MAG: phosphosulfolactate synthase [Actinobacteria bacterium]|nr:phosphosulfolactate synthase [Actinomycetota bacterium]